MRNPSFAKQPRFSSTMARSGSYALVLCIFAAISDLISRRKYFGVLESTDILLSFFTILLIGFCAFCYSAAMYIVFSRAQDATRA